jgi:hypothetical protein
MLTSLEAENYRSIRRIRLDFTNVKNYRFNIECLKGDILDKIVIMGGNGVGKTNFAWAILDIASTLHGGGNIGHMNEGSFLNCYAEGGKASFAYTFNFNGSSVKYRYSKSSPTRLTREEMRVDRRTVFKADHVSGECTLDPRCSIDVTCDGSVPVLRQISEGMCLNGDDPVQQLLEFSSQMLYCHLMMYREVASGIVDLGYHTVEFEGRTYTEEEAIGKVLKWTKYFLRNRNDLDKVDRALEKLQRATRLWAELLPYAWW